MNIVSSFRDPSPTSSALFSKLYFSILFQSRRLEKLTLTEFASVYLECTFRKVTDADDSKDFIFYFFHEDLFDENIIIFDHELYLDSIN